MFNSERKGLSISRAWLILLVPVLAALGGRLTDTLLLMLLLVTHEAAHLAVAAGFGCSIQGIKLTPLGGIAGLGSDLSPLPGVEALVALAGPLHHLLLVLAAQAVPPFIQALGIHWDFFLRANLSLALFNLLPVYPLDGGRLFRAALAVNIGWVKATAFAMRLGRFISSGLVVAGLYNFWRNGGPFLILCGLYLLYAGSHQNDYIFAGQLRLLAGKKARLNAGQGLKTRLLAVPVESLIWPILSRAGSRRYTLFCLLDRAGRPVGWSSEDLALCAITRNGLQTRFGALLEDRGKEIPFSASNQTKRLMQS